MAKRIAHLITDLIQESLGQVRITIWRAIMRYHRNQEVQVPELLKEQIILT